MGPASALDDLLAHMVQKGIHHMKIMVQGMLGQPGQEVVMMHGGPQQGFPHAPTPSCSGMIIPQGNMPPFPSMMGPQNLVTSQNPNQIFQTIRGMLKDGVLSSMESLMKNGLPSISMAPLQIEGPGPIQGAPINPGENPPPQSPCQAKNHGGEGMRIFYHPGQEIHPPFPQMETRVL
jgi:hypothetical protein